MLLVAMVFYPWVMGADLPGLRRSGGFADVHSFRAASRLHQLGVLSVPGAVHGWFVTA